MWSLSQSLWGSGCRSHAAWRGRVGAAHRLRQRRQPAVHPRAQPSRRIRALPGVDAAGTVDTLPFADGGEAQTVAPEGYAPPRDPIVVQIRQVNPGYLGAMGIPLLRGRDVRDGDGHQLLVSEDAATLYWGTERSAWTPRRLAGHVENAAAAGRRHRRKLKQRNLIDGATPTVSHADRLGVQSRRFRSTARLSTHPRRLDTAAAGAIIGACSRGIADRTQLIRAVGAGLGLRTAFVLSPALAISCRRNLGMFVHPASQ